MKSLLWLFGYVREIRTKYIVSLILFILTGVILIANTSIPKWIIDDVIIEQQYDKLPWLLVLLAMGALIANVSHALAGIMNAKNEHYIRRRLTLDYKQILIGTPAERLLAVRTGDMMQTFLTDIAAVSMYPSHIIPNLIRNGVQAIVLAVIIAWASPVLFVALSIFSLLFILLGKKSAPELKSIAHDKQALKSAYTVQVEEGITSTREVISFNRQEWERGKINRAFEAYFRKVMEELRWRNRQLFITEPLQWVPSLVVLGYVGYGVIQGSTSIGVFVVLFQYARQYMDAVASSYHSLVGLSQQQALTERVHHKFMALQRREGEVQLDVPIGSLEFNEVSFHYGEDSRKVFHKLSLSIPIGRKSAIVGASGSGKSTLARLLVRHYEVSEGVIAVNGISLSELQGKDWYDKMAYVPQEPYLLPDTIEANIRFGRDHLTSEDVRRACEAAHIADWIESLPKGYDTFCGERGIQLSGGQRQRIALARAVVETKELLLLDEATSALDQTTERLIQERLDAMRQGKTTITIAHRLSTIQNADVIIVFDKGAVVDSGTHEELLSRCSVYQTLVHVNEDEEMDVAQVG